MLNEFIAVFALPLIAFLFLLCVFFACMAVHQTRAFIRDMDSFEDSMKRQELSEVKDN